MPFDELHEECGVFGIYNFPDRHAAVHTYYGLFAQQHRGQESAGIAVTENGKMKYHKKQGLVQEVFDEEMLAFLGGDSAIGHVRYSTTGKNIVENVQPIVRNYREGKIALAHNGNLINAHELRDEMENLGAIFQTTTDSEVILAQLVKNRLTTESLEEAIQETMQIIRGGYSVLVLTNDKLIAFRDALGIRPLTLGIVGDSYCFASESAAIQMVGGEVIRDVAPGEIISLSREGLQSIRVFTESSRFCSFEYIYFARTDSNLNGLNVYSARLEMGRQLFREHGVMADMVIDVPSSGMAAALGYSYESGIPFGRGFFRNSYVGRTFIKPAQNMREAGVNAKLAPITENVKGKRLIMVDDSIVRGTTIRRIVQSLRDAGAVEVHVMVSSPPVRYSCFYGIDTPKRQHLIAAKHSVAEIQQEIGADSLHYLSLEGLRHTLSGASTGSCLACFNGDYPIPGDLTEQSKTCC